MRLNPILWLHVQLVSGWRSTLIMAVLYVAVFVVGTSMVYRMSGPGTPYPSIAAGALSFVTVSQGLFLVLLGPGSLHKSIQRDCTTGMMESHRIAPLSGPRIVLGYLGGGYVQAGVLYATSLVLGTFFAAQTQLPLAVGAWWGAQLCILCLTLMFASLVLLVGLASRGKVNALGIVLPFSFFAGAVAVKFVPGLALIGGVLTFNWLLAVFRGGTPTSGNAAVATGAMIAQIGLAATFLIAAFRKVRSPEKPLFPVWLSFILLAISGAILLAGVALASGSVSFMGGGPDAKNLAQYQMTFSLIGFFAVAQFPLIAAAAECFFVDRARAFGEPGRVTRRAILTLTPPVLAAATVLVAALLVRQLHVTETTGFERLWEATRGWRAYAAIAVAMLLSFWTDFNLIYFAISRGRSPMLAVVLSAIVLKVAPFLLDGLLMMLAEMRDAQLALVDGYFAGASPLGTIVLAIDPAGSPAYGLMAQVLIAALAGYLGMRGRRALQRDPREAIAATAPQG
jgi:hypothetical protein